MPIIRFSLIAAALFLAAPAAAQTYSEVTIGDHGAVIIPEAHRGKLLPDEFFPGRVVFSDELGWYRFTMDEHDGDSVTTSTDGTVRSFKFQDYSIRDRVPFWRERPAPVYECDVIRLPDTSLSGYTWSQIQANLVVSNEKFTTTFNTLRNHYLDDIISEGNFVVIPPGEIVAVDARDLQQSIPLSFPGFPFEPVRVLYYHVRHKTNGIHMEIALVPSPVGALVVACNGAEGGGRETHEVIKRNLQIGSAMTSPP